MLSNYSITWYSDADGWRSAYSKTRITTWAKSRNTSCSDWLHRIFTHPRASSYIADLESDLDWLQTFYTDRTTLEIEIVALKQKIALDGQLWISWPKKSSRLATTINDEVVRKIGLQTGLVDVKVAAINETWSGLKFVYRLQDR